MLEIPFNSTDKFQANVHLFRGKYLVCFKGAPERVLERCSTVAFGNETRNLNEETKIAYTESCYALANNGERILGFADLELSPSIYHVDYRFEADPPNFPLNNLRLVCQFVSFFWNYYIWYYMNFKLFKLTKFKDLYSSFNIFR